MNTRVALITQSEYARRRGVAKSAVAKAVSEGRISLVNGKIDPAVADIQWEQNTRARADSKRSSAGNADGAGVGKAQADIAPPAADPASAQPSYTDYRTIREKAEAEMAQRNNLKAAGLLVERVQVERGVFDTVRTLRDVVMTVGQRVAPKCIGMTDPREIEHAITDELRKALEGFEARLIAKLPQKEMT